MKARVDQDEWWPVYWIVDHIEGYTAGKVVELPPGFKDRLHKAEIEFDACQAVLAELWKKAKP